MRPPLAALLLVAVLLTSGCLGGPSRPPSDQRALDALNHSQDAMAEVTSYRTTVDGRVTATGNDEERTVSLTGTVAVNASTQQMNATASAGERQNFPGRSGTQRTYIDGYTTYAECARINWERQNLSESRPWLTYTPVGQQLAVLDETNVYWNGTEPVDGREAGVILAHPTQDELQAVPNVRNSGASDIADSNLDNATLRLWIDTDSGRPLKARRHIRVSESGTTATATVTFRFTDYNEPTTVTVPELDDETFWNTGCPG